MIKKHGNVVLRRTTTHGSQHHTTDLQKTSPPPGRGSYGCCRLLLRPGRRVYTSGLVHAFNTLSSRSPFPVYIETSTCPAVATSLTVSAENFWSITTLHNAGAANSGTVANKAFTSSSDLTDSGNNAVNLAAEVEVRCFVERQRGRNNKKCGLQDQCHAPG